MKIAVIFPIFNGLEYTKRCLEVLFEQFHEISPSLAEYSVIVVDDGSSDGSGTWIEQHYPQVNLLRGDGTLWWSGGINKALEFGLNQIKADYFIWWNNDIIPGKDYFLNAATLISKGNPQIIFGSKIFLAQQRDIIWSMGGLFNPKSGEKSMIGTHKKNSDAYEKQIDCDWLTGMGTITHNSVYRETGLLDEHNFPQYHGDADFTFRAKKSGYSIITDPSLIIYNDTRHSGLKHDERFMQLWRSLFSIRSNFNIKKDFLFYRKHSTSLLAYKVPLMKYIKYTGGFIKWKILHFFGIQRKK
jgi:GT2 family glycosyltransferase